MFNKKKNEKNTHKKIASNGEELSKNCNKRPCEIAKGNQDTKNKKSITLTTHY